MHLGHLILLLALVVSVSATPAHGKRSTHLEKNFDPSRRHLIPDSHFARGTRNRHGKRIVKKRKTCQVRNNSTAVLPSISTDSSSASLNWPSASISSLLSSVTSLFSQPSSVTSFSAQPSALTSLSTQPSGLTSLSAQPSLSAQTSSTPSVSNPASTTFASSAAPSPSASNPSNSDWTLVETVSGSNFFDAWNFWSWDDPTHGTVDYVDSTTAWNQGLISINNAGNAIMTVDTTPQVSGGRQAVRIHSNKIWTGGLVLMDAVHMPTGCGTWPAWWMNGPNWPNGGEIDILEGVNAFSENQVSLHTGDGCTMPNTLNQGQTGQVTTGNYDSYNCASYATSNQGCGVRAVGDETSYGPGFNNIGGGVYALKWDKTGITAWWFPRTSIPSDITNSTPDPSSWPTPMAHFPSDSCDPYTYFYDNFNIFTNTFCGDWAGADGVWNYAGYAGQSQSCAAITGYSTCADYVLNQGGDFTQAYWEVSYVKYFNSTSQV